MENKPNKPRTSSKVKNRYNKKTYDNILLVVKKGEKELIKAFAESRGMSLNGFITSLVREEMEREDRDLI